MYPVTLKNAAGATVQAQDANQEGMWVKAGYSPVDEPMFKYDNARKAVPQITDIVVYRHPGAPYTKNKSFYVPAVVLGSNSDGTVNLYVLSEYNEQNDNGISEGPDVGQYQSKADAIAEMSKQAAAKDKADALQAKVAKDLAAKTAVEEKQHELAAK